MTTYTVTAGNKYFYQTLVVNAADSADAANKFHAFLDSPEQKKLEQEETKEAEQEFGEQDPGDHEYWFQDEDVEERDHFPRWHGEPSDQVQVISAGGNG